MQQIEKRNPRRNPRQINKRRENNFTIFAQRSRVKQIVTRAQKNNNSVSILFQ